MEKSQSIKEIAAALLLFNTKMDHVKRDAQNPFFKSKYATLSNILESIQVPLLEAGLSFCQMPDGDQLVTLIIHTESGEYFQSAYPIKPTRNDPQSFGSAVTYARRYALTSILGINVEDDDGTEASAPAAENAQHSATENKNDDQRPWLTQKMFESAKERMGNGEDDLLEQIKRGFRMKKEYRKELEEIQKQITA